MMPLLHQFYIVILCIATTLASPQVYAAPLVSDDLEFSNLVRDRVFIYVAPEENCELVDSRIYSLPELVKISLCINPQLRSEQYRVLVSAAKVKQTESAYFPRISFSTSHSRNDMRSDVSESSDLGNQFQLNLQARLWDFGSRSKVNAAAVFELRGAVDRYLEMYYKAAEEFVFAYYDYAFALASVRARASIASSDETALNIAKSKFSKGAISQFDLDEVSLASIRSNKLLVVSKWDLSERLRKLSVLLGTKVDNSNINIQTIDYLKAKSFVADLYYMSLRNVDNHPTISKVQNALNANKLRMDALSANRYPTIDLNSGISQGGAFGSSYSRSIAGSFNLGVSLSWTLFDGFENKHQVAESLSQTNSLEKDLVFSRQSIKANLNEYYTEFEYIGSQLFFFENLVQKGGQLSVSAGRRYKSISTDFGEISRINESYVGDLLEFEQKSLNVSKLFLSLLLSNCAISNFSSCSSSLSEWFP